MSKESGAAVKTSAVFIFIYKPRADRFNEFWRVYGSLGEWDTYFAHFPEYQGLTCNAIFGGRYAVIETWASAEAREQVTRQPKYKSMCERYANLYEWEKELGPVGVEE
jgi:hypothetical protein